MGCPGRWRCTGGTRLITCLQTLPFTPELAPATLRMLALIQGGRLDDPPRRGARQDRRRAAVRRAGRVRRAAHRLLLRRGRHHPALRDPARRVRALDRRRRAGPRAAPPGPDGAGLDRRVRRPVRRRLPALPARNTRTGLDNQCWRNSAGRDRGRRRPAGRLPARHLRAPGVRVRRERRGARLAREFWGDPGYADRLEREAAPLRERFNRDFWLPQRGYYALAVQPDGEPVDALTSNLGHLLWSGIVEPDRADALAGHLLRAGAVLRLGRAHLRQRAAATTRWAHIGAVWPSDNALIARGCAGPGSGRRPPGSPPGCSTPPGTSRAGCRRTSPATTGPPPTSPSRTASPTARTRRRPECPCDAAARAAWAGTVRGPSRRRRHGPRGTGPDRAARHQGAAGGTPTRSAGVARSATGPGHLTAARACLGRRQDEIQNGGQPRAGNQSAISRLALSVESEACTRFSRLDSDRSPRIVPAAALRPSVAADHRLGPPRSTWSPESTSDTSGPLVMNVLQRRVERARPRARRSAGRAKLAVERPDLQRVDPAGPCARNG